MHAQRFPCGSGFDIVHSRTDTSEGRCYETHLIVYVPSDTFLENDWEIVLSVDKNNSIMGGLDALMVELTKRLGDKIGKYGSRG